MKRVVIHIATCFFLLIALQVHAQVKYPVTVNSFMTNPSPVYLSDYAAPATDSWKNTLIFNDFNEPSWQVSLRITISSNRLRLKTKPGYRSPNFITLYPGVAYNLGPAELYEYLLSQNMDVSGSGAGLFLSTGRLPEGFYNFCIEVLDNNSGQPISLPGCASAWIQLKDPPLNTMPVCDGFVPISETQNITFQWQPVSVSPVENVMLEYYLTIHEVTDLSVDPKAALMNGMALQVFESQPLMSTSYFYSLADYVLEPGKVYLYQVQAVDANGKDVFKNNGFSEPCVFYYGYPEGGFIELITPKDSYQFNNQEVKAFRWGSPDKKITNQPFEYEMQIVEVEAGQDSLQAITDNEAVYSFVPPVTFSTAEYQRNIEAQDFDFEAGKKYAWRVVARSEEQTVATSEIGTFLGPQVVDFFYAKGYLVNVETVTNGDLNNLAGTCKVKLGDEILEGDFDSLQIVMLESRPVLNGGEIIFAEGEMEPLALTPHNAVNDSAFFYGNQLKLNKEGFFIRGNIEWPLHLMVNAPEAGKVVTKTNWFSFFDKNLAGGARLRPDNQFYLLDPFGFQLNLDSTSLLTVSNNQYKVYINGHLQMPESQDYENKQLSYSFFEVDNLHYLQGQEITSHQLNFPVVENTGLYLNSKNVIIDLSDWESPPKHQLDENWKGIYFDKYAISLTDKPDNNNQLTSAATYTWFESDHESNPDHKAWIDGEGFTCYVKQALPSSEIKCNQFPSEVTDLLINLEAGVMHQSHLLGQMHIPFISDTALFNYTVPITTKGFSTAYLHGLEDYQMTLNPENPDQLLELRFARAEFKGNDRITATVSLNWPVLKAEMEHVSGFNIYGNGELGFHTPNGTTSLTHQINSKIRGYGITIDAVGAGRNENKYSVAASFKINMSDDISGIDGPPITSFYSLAERNSIDKDYVGPANNTSGGGIWTPSGFKQADELSNEDLADMMEQEINGQIAASYQETDASADQLSQLISDDLEEEVPLTSGGENNDSTATEQRGGIFTKLSPKEGQILESIVVGFSDELTRPLRGKVDKWCAETSAKLDNFILGKVGDAKGYLNNKIDTLIIGLMTEAAGKIDINGVNDEVIFESLSASIRANLIQETNEALMAAVKEHITEPIKADINTKIPHRIDSLIRYSTSGIIFAMLEGEMDKSFVEDELFKNTAQVGEEIAVDFYNNHINPEAIAIKIKNTAKTTLKNINTRELLEQILRDFAKQMITLDNIAALANTLGFDNLAGYLLAEGSFANELVSTGINFAGMGQKSAEDYFSLDPSNINIQTPWLSLTGVTEFYPDDTTYGDIWRSDISLVIKKPKDIPLQGTYINGKFKNGKDFWFAQVAADDQPIAPGGPIRKKARAVAQPIDLGFVQVMAASVRVYKHMREQGGVNITPDESVMYGGYFNFILFDKKKKGGNLRLDLEGELIADADGEIQIDFAGRMQMLNKEVDVDTASSSMANVDIFVHYNSREEHFLGQVIASIQSPALCCEGFLEVETKPDYWHVYVGTYEQKVKITPACAGWGGVGYLMLNNTQLEVGLGVSLQFAAKAGFDIGIFALGISVEGYAAAGVTAGLQYRPSLKILKAGVWLELYAKVVLRYKAFLIKGSVTLLELYVMADLFMYFDPPPTLLEGSVKGYAAILNGLIKCDFDAGFKKTL